MSKPHIPPEILDDVVDLLCDEPETLEECCLVSKSWIPRTRKHLFAEVNFPNQADLESWKNLFPDPSTSPGHYTKNLIVGFVRVGAVDAEAGGWIKGFSCVVCLELGKGFGIHEPGISLVPFHGFSPILQSLCMDGFDLPSSHIFSLALSFPLLDDLTLTAYREFIDDGDDSDGLSAIAQSSSLPKFGGSLDIPQPVELKPILRRLLSLPGSIHFRKLNLIWVIEEDILLTTALMERCSHTLESFKFTCTHLGTYIRSPYVSPLITSVSSRVRSSFDQPLEGDKDQKRCPWDRGVAEGRLDHYDPPNHHTRTSRSSTNLDSPGFPPTSDTP